MLLGGLVKMLRKNSPQDCCAGINSYNPESNCENYLSIIDELSRSEIALSFNEIAILLDDKSDYDILFQVLLEDKRFFILGNEDNFKQVQCFPKATFIRRLWELNKRACELGLDKLDSNMFLKSISPLFPIPLDLKDKVCLLNWMTKYGLAIWEDKIISFPNRNLITKLSRVLKDDWSGVLADMIVYDPDKNALNKLSKEYLKVFLKNTLKNTRNLKILSMRLGLTDNTTYTLENIGGEVGLTREAIRLVEKKFWESLPKRLEHDRSLMKSLLCVIAKSGGNKLFAKAKEEHCNQLKFLCRAFQIEFGKSGRLGIHFIGVNHKVIRQLEALLKDPRCINREYICLLIDEVKGLALTHVDKHIISRVISKKVRSGLALPEIIYFGLERMGRPAHYTEITKACFDLFPERNITPRNLHAVLCRDPKSQLGEFPWVWTGARGIFALKEWGYTKPKYKLHDAVFEIVKHKYSKTGKPVNFAIVQAEIGKYRKIVKESSLILACYCNDKITAIGKDQFVPFGKAKSIVGQNKILDKLDKKLRGFDRTLVEKGKRRIAQ
jgi:hypothetical protein